MQDYLIIPVAIILTWLLLRLFKQPACKHAEQIFYDAAGEELPGDQSDACFSRCLKCGQVSVIPSGFQSDAHFESYLHQREQGGSDALRKIKHD
jgi:hypothetical protein